MVEKLGRKEYSEILKWLTFILWNLDHVENKDSKSKTIVINNSSNKSPRSVAFIFHPEAREYSLSL